MWHYLNSFTLPNDPEGLQEESIKLVEEKAKNRDQIFQRRLKKAVKNWEMKTTKVGNFRAKKEAMSHLKKMISNDIKDKMRRVQAYMKIIYKP